MKNFYKILDSGIADIKISEIDVIGYTEFEVGSEPTDLEEALLLGIENSKQVSEAKQYLNDTDWVASKLAEYQAGIITEDVKTKYADIFIQREQKRILINSKGA